MRILILASLVFCVALTAAAESSPELSTDDDKSIYLLGASLGRNVTQFDFDDREIAIIKRGFDDTLRDNELAVNVEEFGPKVNEFVERRNARTAAKERAAAKKLLDEAEKVPGAIKTDSGLVYKEKKAGDGATPTATDVVKVHYHGTRGDGSVFDSSRDRGEPVSFPLNGVIPCWTEALQRMQVGGEAELVCPPDLAYGDRGFRGIRPGAALRFEVELIDIE